jgi:hypothetical protein
LRYQKGFKEGKMSNQEYIRAVVRGAEVYRKQGLLAEAREKYIEALSFVSRDGEDVKALEWREALKMRLRSVEESLVHTEEVDEHPELPEKAQNLIQRLFSFSPSGDVTTLEGAVALWKFGQHRRALGEFERLLDMGHQPLVAAKYILLCLLTLSCPESAIARFRKWGFRGTFSEPEMQHLRDFLCSEFRARGLELDLPSVTERASQHGKKEDLEPPVSSITIDFEWGPMCGRRVELGVTFQFGNALSVIVPALNKELVEALKPGTRIGRVGLYSATVFFRGNGTVAGSTRIKHGPRQGDYLIDITIEES